MPADDRGKDSSQLPSAPPSARNGPPSSGAFPPSSSAPPLAFVAWGAVRDAITSIHNLETLLKSPRIGGRVLGEVLPEFLGGVAVLRGAFNASAAEAGAAATRAAREALARFATSRLDELEGAMRAASPGELDVRLRLALEQVATRVSADLDCAAELLDLSERAEHATSTELSWHELARVTLRAPSRGRSEREIPVRLAPGDEHTLRGDPHVLKRLLAFAVARTYATAATMGVTIRAAAEGERLRVAIGASQPTDSAIAPVSLRLVRRVDPTDAIVEAAALGAAIELRASDDGVTLWLATAR